MRINVRSEGSELRPQLRRVVVSRLLAALGPFRAHIESVDVRLRISARDTQPQLTTCDVAVSLRPSGLVHARSEDARTRVAIDHAAVDVRAGVEREVSRLQTPPRAPHAAEAGPGSLELVLTDDRISRQQHEPLERAERSLRPSRVRERWRPPGG